MNNPNRKVNWLSRKAHIALVILKGAHNFGLRSNPEIYQASDCQVGYTTFSTGISELSAMHLVRRNNKTVSFDNGIATRTFKGVCGNLSESDYEYLTKTIGGIYKDGFSVENVAAAATVCYIDSLEQTAKNGGWFSLETYQKHLKVPSQKSRTVRTPSDALGYVEMDHRTKMYRWKKGAHYEIYEKLLTIDTIIESYNLG
jgi:hypothetical protein